LDLVFGQSRGGGVKDYFSHLNSEKTEKIINICVVLDRPGT